MISSQILARRFACIAAIGNAVGVLDWNSQTMMPSAAAPGRAEQWATLRVMT